jgi:hypothetical protein
MKEFFANLRNWIAELGAAWGGIDAEYLVNENRLKRKQPQGNVIPIKTEKGKRDQLG